MDKPYKLKRPKDIDRYVISKANQHYLFFNRKEQKAYCTCCGKMIDLKYYDFYGAKLKHNERTWCLNCKSEVVIKSSGYGRNGLEENGRILWFRKKGNKTYAQLDEYDIFYDEYIPQIYYRPSAQYEFSSKGSKCFVKSRYASYWHERSSVTIPSARIGIMGFYQTGRYEKTIVYEPSIKRFGNDLKYQSLTNKILTYGDAAELIVKYLDNFLKYPAVEILEKSGFENVVLWKLETGRNREVNWRKKDLTEILKLKPGEVKDYRNIIAEKTTISPDEILRNYREKTQALGKQITFEIAEKIRGVPDANLYKVLEYLPIEKAIKYMDSQNTNFSDYADYIRDCELMNKNLKKKRIIRPKDFEEEHYKLAKIVEVAVDNKTVALFKNTENKIAGSYSGFQYKDLFIRIAEQPAELERESEKLHHCVRTYVNKVARGESAILFLRRVAEPDASYYTVEMLLNGEIPQIRGLRNEPATEEIEEFIKAWKTFIEKENEKRSAA